MRGSKHVYVTNLADLAPPSDGSGEMTEALVHRTPDAQLVVQLVPAGSELEAHRHSGLWDYFVGLSGHATVTLTLTGDEESSFELAPGGFLAVPPGTTHHISNHDLEVPFVFLLTQSPYSAYDFVTG